MQGSVRRTYCFFSCAAPDGAAVSGETLRPVYEDRGALDHPDALVAVRHNLSEGCIGHLRAQGSTP